MATGNASGGSPKSGRAAKSKAPTSAPEAPLVPAQPPEVPPISRPVQLTPEDMAVLIDQGVGLRLTTLTQMVQDAVGTLRKGKTELEKFLGSIADSADLAQQDAAKAKEEAEIGTVLSVIGLFLLLVVIFWQGCSTRSIHHAVFTDKDENRIEAMQGQLEKIGKQVEEYEASHEPTLAFVLAEKTKRDEAERLAREAAQKAFDEEGEQIAACVKGAKTPEERMACTSAQPQQPVAAPAANLPDPLGAPMETQLTPHVSSHAVTTCSQGNCTIQKKP